VVTNLIIFENHVGKLKLTVVKVAETSLQNLTGVKNYDISGYFSYSWHNIQAILQRNGEEQKYIMYIDQYFRCDRRYFPS
jgi:hypothetical protein